MIIMLTRDRALNTDSVGNTLYIASVPILRVYGKHGQLMFELRGDEAVEGQACLERFVAEGPAHRWPRTDDRT